MKPLYLVAQSPLPLQGIADEQLSKRLVHATQATASRSSFVIDAAINDLQTNLDKPKTDQWRDETMRLVNQIREQSLDGVQAQFLAQHITREEQNEIADSINKRGVDAKKALYSSPSPLLGAYAFSEKAHAFIRLVEQEKERMISFAQTPDLYKKHQPKSEVPQRS